MVNDSNLSVSHNNKIGEDEYKLMVVGFCRWNSLFQALR